MDWAPKDENDNDEMKPKYSRKKTAWDIEEELEQMARVQEEKRAKKEREEKLAQLKEEQSKHHFEQSQVENDIKDLLDMAAGGKKVPKKSKSLGIKQ